jgi:hypothetical protein
MVSTTSTTTGTMNETESGFSNDLPTSVEVTITGNSPSIAPPRYAG